VLLCRGLFTKSIRRQSKSQDHDSDLQGQLNPSKSIGGFEVYGLDGRLALAGGVKAPPSSLGSRGGSLKVGLDEWDELCSF
jgi:hypothetical protein